MRFLLTFCFILIMFVTNAQIYFQDFENGFNDMILIDADNNTPNIIVDNFFEAWTISDNPKLGNGTLVAISNSWYTPSGTANDWMITPKINIPNENIVLNWQAKSFNMDFRDGYQVLVSTTGTEIADFKDVLFEIKHEMVEWTEHFVSLKEYNGKKIHIAYRNNSEDMVLLGIDNIKIEEILGNSAKINSITTHRYHEINKSITIDGTIVNTGANDISTIEIQYEIENQSFIKKLNDLSIPYGKIYAFSLTPEISLTEFKDYHFIFSTNKPNGVEDTIGENETYDLRITPVCEIPKRIMVAEESTSTTCGICPQGHVWMDYMQSTYPEDFIGIAIHIDEDDPMNVDPYSNPLEKLAGFKGAPQVLINRKQFFAVTDLELMHTSIVNEITPIGFTDQYKVVINDTNQTVQVGFSAKAFANLDEIDYRFNVILVEEKVHNTSEEYNQVNYFSQKEPKLDGAGHNWFSESNPVPASKMKYNHVARSILGGWNGYKNSIPNTLFKNQEIQKTYIGYISSEWKRENMFAIITIINNENGEILNAKKISIAQPVFAQNIENAASHVTIFPNPTSGTIQIHPSYTKSTDIQIQLMDINGKIIHRESLSHVRHEMITLSQPTLNSGLYFLQIMDGINVDVVKLIIK